MSNKPVRVRNRTVKQGARASITTSKEKVVSGESQGVEESISKEMDRAVENPNPAYVSVNGGMTINTGNYESIKIGVSVSFPCEPTTEAVKETYGDVTKLVDEFLDAEYLEATREEE